MSERTPWGRMLAHACWLGVAPAAFWRLSLCEWRALMQTHDANAALSRESFAALLHRFPDKAP